MREARAARPVRRLPPGGLAAGGRPPARCLACLFLWIAQIAQIAPIVPIARTPRIVHTVLILLALAFGLAPTGLLRMAYAGGSPRVAATPVPYSAIPGFHSPPAALSGTSVSGAVRVEPAHMPFYVATKGTTTIYLLGTLHIGDPSDYPPGQPFRRPILAALAASPTLALELSPDDLIQSQDDVSKYGVCTYACLPRLLPPPLWRKLEARLRGNPAALAEIQKTRPWLAALLVETYSSLSAGLQTEYGTEAQLQNVYLRTPGKVVGLETLSEQMRAFTNLTLAEQREMLAQDLEETPEQTAADVKELHRLWRAGDADAIAAWSTAKSERLATSAAAARALDNKVVFERNRRFTARLQQLAAPNRPVFVAIGSLHLGGPKGVLALLRQHGFIVEPS